MVHQIVTGQPGEQEDGIARPTKGDKEAELQVEGAGLVEVVVGKASFRTS